MTGPFSIVGYDYWDERLCPDDMKARMLTYVLDPAMTTEQVLDLAADLVGINRQDESSFETTPVGHIPVFPKPIRRSQIDETTVCDNLPPVSAVPVGGGVMKVHIGFTLDVDPDARTATSHHMSNFPLRDDRTVSRGKHQVRQIASAVAHRRVASPA